jgi:hypothetical protein
MVALHCVPRACARSHKMITPTAMNAKNCAGVMDGRGAFV